MTQNAEVQHVNHGNKTAYHLEFGFRSEGAVWDDVYSIGKTNFAFYQAKNQTEVMSHGLTIFDNSSRDFPYISGAQRLELFLIHKFAGRTLTQTPPSIQLVFESRSKLSPFRFLACCLAPQWDWVLKS